ncbi:unnamed protein product [Leuciscus chuanchicus]
MKAPGEAENGRLDTLLFNTLAREKRLWRTPVLKNGCVQGSDISPAQYHEVIVWLRDMSGTFQFSSETYALGVCVLNSLLAAVKVSEPTTTHFLPTRAQTLSSPSFSADSVEIPQVHGHHLSDPRCEGQRGGRGKTQEPQRHATPLLTIPVPLLFCFVGEQVIASVKDLLEQSRCKFSTAEILRMERVILNKLHWDLYIATPMDFIHIYHGLLMSRVPGLVRAGSQNRPVLQASLWTRQAQHCMACHQLWQFKGSILALAIITLELETLTPDWFSVFTDLLRKAQISSTEFICCKETVDEYLTGLRLFSSPSNTVYILDSSSMLAFRRQDRRKREHGEHDIDDFYDGFWCLYDEEPSMKTGRRDGLQDMMSSCPPLLHKQ